MGYAQYVGRVGALAVALGISSAVTQPVFAWAEDPAPAGATDNAPAEPAAEPPAEQPADQAEAADPAEDPEDDTPPAINEDDPASDVENTEDPDPQDPVSEDPTPTPEVIVEDETPPNPDTGAAPNDARTIPEPGDPTQKADPQPDTDGFVAHALKISGVAEFALDAPLTADIALPVAATLAAPSTAAPEATVTITAVSPTPAAEVHPFRSLVLGVLGIFGFDPDPGVTNDPLLQALWAAYRGYERRYENESPTVGAANVIATSLTEDGHIAVTLSVGFTDPDGDTLHYTTTNGATGTLSANTDGTYTYLTDTVGTDTVTITANDDDGTSHLHGLFGWLFKPAAGHTRTVTVTLTVTAPTNTAPTANDDTATTDEDTPVTIHVLANDTDPDGDPLSIGSFSHGAHGIVTLDGDTLTYTPDENYNGTDEFSYTTTDGTLASPTTHVTITVAAVNDSPVITVSVVGQPNPTTGVVIGHVTATDVDGDTLAYQISTDAAAGHVVIDSQTGQWNYTPTTDAWKTADANATDVFTVTVTDGHTGSTNATVTLHVAPPVEPTYAVVATIATEAGARPTFIVFNADGSKAYVTNQGDGTVSVIDTTTREIIKNIAVIPGTETANTTEPTMLTIGPSGLLYVTNKSGVVAVINPTTDTLQGFIGTGSGNRAPIGIVFANGYGFVGQGTVGEVFVFNAATGQGVTVIGVPPVNAELTASPDGAYVYLAAQANAEVHVISTTTNTVVETISIGGGSFPTNIAFTNNGTRAYVTEQNANGVAVIDTATQSVIDHIPVGSRPIDIAVNADDTRAYVTNQISGTVTVIDLTSNTVIHTIDVGLLPTGVAITPDGKYLYVANQGGGISIVALTELPTGTAPVATDDTATTNEDTPVVIHVLANDTDPDGDPLSIATVTQGDHSGTVTVNADGTVTYDPAENYSGTETFTYTVTDGTANSNTATVTVTVNTVDNAPPSVGDPAFSITAVDAVTGKVTGTVHVTDENQTGLAYSISQPISPTLGQVTLTGNGGFIFTPTGTARLNAYAGSGPTHVEFEMSVSDGQYTATIPVTAVIDPASAAVTGTFDAGTGPAGIAISADGNRIYISNFSGMTVTVVDATTLAIVNGRPATPGINPIQVGPNATDLAIKGNVLYVANKGSYNGFGTVSVVNTTTGDETALIYVDDGPRWLALNGDRLYVSNFNGQSISVIDTTTNSVIDTDPAAVGANPIELSAIAIGIAATADHLYVTNQLTDKVTVFDTSTFAIIGELTARTDPYDVVADGNTIYVSSITDNTVSVINATTGAPISADIAVGGGASFMALHGNRLYVSNAWDGTVSVIDTATNSVVETVRVGPIPGRIAVNPDGSKAYVINADETISVITVIAPTVVNQAPVATNDTIHMDNQSSISVSLLNSSSDPDGDNLTGTLVTDVAHGVLNFFPNRTFNYHANANFVGVDTFTYKVNDGTLDSNIATVTIIVTAVNHPPVASADAVTVDEDSGATAIDVLSNDTDADSNTMTVTAVGTPDGGGHVVVNADGTIGYTPVENFNGTETFTYTATDGTANSNTATVTVTVNPVDDAPVIQSIVSTQQSATSWIVTVTAYDPDGDPIDITLTADDPTKVSITPMENLLSARMFSIAAFDAGPEPTTADYLVEITDPAWALANPGAPLGITAGVTDGNSEPVTQDAAAGRVTNFIGLGFDYFPHLDIPAGPDGLYYTKAAVSLTDVVLLLSDGTAVLYGHTYGGADLPNPEIPDLPDGVTYTDVAVWDSYKTLLLRSDGIVVPLSVDPDFGAAVEIPNLPAGTTYTGVAGTGFNGDGYAVLLRSDGTAVLLKNGAAAATELPAAGDGLTYTQVSAGPAHLVLLRSDGTAVAYAPPGTYSPNTYGELDIPALPSGLDYTQVAAGNYFTLLLRSDGTVVAIGRDDSGQIDVPPLAADLTYTAIAAGNQHAVLLRSDGAVLALGSNAYYGQTAIPALPAGTTYTQVYAGLENTLLATGLTTGLSAGPDQATVNEDAQVTVAVLGNDTDPDGNPLNIANVTPGSHGSTAINADGTITYTPAPDYYGVDTFAYTLSNGVTSSVAGVTVKVISQLDAPRAQDAEYYVAAGSVLYINMADKVYDPPDPWVFPFNGRVQLEIASQPSLGSATFSQLTYLTYTAPADLEGATSTTFTFYGNDGPLHGNIATVTINFVTGI